jgi:NOL1/NOP2/fmu family ribosome biogenesis protein
VKISVDLSSDSNEIKQYLNGQTLRLSDSSFAGKESAKGWCLVTTDGYSIGWGKLASGMLKNHYPKGLRINY